MDKLLRQKRSPGVRMLASGTKCSAYMLGDGLVGKAWVRRKTDELTCLRDFYADLADSTLPFTTPRIHGVRSVNGVPVTIEHELHGLPLQKRLDENDRTPCPEAVNCLLKVLRALRSVEGTPRMSKLAVLATILRSLPERA